MTTLDPVQAVQTGVQQLMRNDPTIMQLVTDVLDEEPDTRNFPYITVPDPESIPDGTHDDPGRRIELRIHTYARGDVRPRNYRVDNQVGARIVTLFDHQHAALDPFVAGHSVWMIRHVSARKMPDRDRSIRHRMDRIRVWTTNS